MTGIILAAQKGIGKLPSEEKGDIEESRFFSFELMLQMLVSSEMIQDTYTALFEACGAVKEKEKAAVDMMTLVTLLLILETAAECGNLNRELLFEGMQENLTKKIALTANFLDNAIASGTFDTTKVIDLNIALQQAKLRLEENDIGSFREACQEALKTIGIDKSQWSKELQQVEKYTNRLSSLLGEQAQSDINTMTGFFQAG